MSAAWHVASRYVHAGLSHGTSGQVTPRRLDFFTSYMSHVPSSHRSMCLIHTTHISIQERLSRNSSKMPKKHIKALKKTEPHSVRELPETARNGAQNRLTYDRPPATKNYYGIEPSAAPVLPSLLPVLAPLLPVLPPLLPGLAARHLKAAHQGGTAATARNGAQNRFTYDRPPATKNDYGIQPSAAPALPPLLPVRAPPGHSPTDHFIVTPAVSHRSFYRNSGSFPPKFP